MGQYIFEPLSNPITGLFTIIIGVFFSIAVFSFVRNKDRVSAFDRYAPTGLTTIGVIGTFLGIFVGLIDFDVTDIDGSIPSLLSGLKIAFSTSILGMVSSVILKLIQTRKKRNSIKEDVSAGDIFKVMTEVRDETKFNRDHMDSLIVDLKKAISGDGDSSLVTQIQKFRASSHDDSQEFKKVTKEGFESLKIEFQTFAEKMADSNSKALIDALQEVIRDFNTKINEQFGENFKQLNEAVGGLLTWQENYKTHVESLVADFDEVRKGISETRDVVRTIGEQCKVIPETMGELRNTIKLADDQIEVLKSHLDAVSYLRDNAIQAFPVIEENIEKLTTNFTSSMTKSAELVTASLNEQTNIIKNISEQNISLLEDATSRHKQLVGKFEVAIDTCTNEMESSIRNQSEVVQEISSGFRDTLHKSLADTNELIQVSFTEFDKQMQSEIERTIQAMGSHLASLSNKFVEDYSPLTEKLRRMMELARRAGE